MTVDDLCMATTLTFIDRAPSGRQLHSCAVTFPEARLHLTIQDLIELRVRTEVREYNAGITTEFHGLVDPMDRVADGSLATRIRINEAAQVFESVRAFVQNYYAVFVDGLEADDLDTELTIDEAAELSFVRLLPSHHRSIA